MSYIDERYYILFKSWSPLQNLGWRNSPLLLITECWTPCYFSINLLSHGKSVVRPLYRSRCLLKCSLRCHTTVCWNVCCLEISYQNNVIVLQHYSRPEYLMFQILSYHRTFLKPLHLNDLPNNAGHTSNNGADWPYQRELPLLPRNTRVGLSLLFQLRPLLSQRL